MLFDIFSAIYDDFFLPSELTLLAAALMLSFTMSDYLPHLIFIEFAPLFSLR